LTGDWVPDGVVVVGDGYLAERSVASGGEGDRGSDGDFESTESGDKGGDSGGEDSGGVKS
jgi:hypothetical protein